MKWYFRLADIFNRLNFTNTPMKTPVFISLLLLSVMARAQLLVAINEDSTQIRRFRPRQFIECLVTTGKTAPGVVYGRLKLFDANSFLLETGRNQWTSVWLSDVIAVRRSNRRAAWPMLFGGGSTMAGSSAAGLVTQRINPVNVAGAAIMGAGIATLRGDFSSRRYRWSIYQGWQFGIVSKP